MNRVGNRSLILLFTLFLSVILCGAVSATTDNSIPVVKAVDPSNNSVNVDPNKLIKVTYSESIKFGSNYVELKTSGGTVVPSSRSISGNILTIKPFQPLKINTKYNLIIHSGSIKDLSGNSNKLYVSTFKTAPYKLIDSGVTTCYWFPGSKYYWKTYLYSDRIVVYSHFYNPNLNRQLYQTTTIKSNIVDGKRFGVYFAITPKSNGESAYINVSSGFKGTSLQYYWSYFRAYMISLAPNH